MNAKPLLYVSAIAVLVLAMTTPALGSNLCYVRYAGGGTHTQETEMATRIFQTVSTFALANDIAIADATTADIDDVITMLTRCLGSGKDVIINGPGASQQPFIGPILYGLSLAFTGGFGGRHVYVVSCNLPALSTGTAFTLTKLKDSAIKSSSMPYTYNVAVIDTSLGVGPLTTYIAWLNAHVEQPVGSAGKLINVMSPAVTGATLFAPATAQASLLYRDPLFKQGVLSTITTAVATAPHAPLNAGSIVSKIPTKTAADNAGTTCGTYSQFPLGTGTMADAVTQSTALVNAGAAIDAHVKTATTVAGLMAAAYASKPNKGQEQTACELAAQGATVSVGVADTRTFVSAFPHITFVSNAIFSLGWPTLRNHHTVTTAHSISFLEHRSPGAKNLLHRVRQRRAQHQQRQRQQR